MSFSKKQNYCKNSKTMPEISNLYLGTDYFYSSPNEVSFKAYWKKKKKLHIGCFVWFPMEMKFTQPVYICAYVWLCLHMWARQRHFPVTLLLATKLQPDLTSLWNAQTFPIFLSQLKWLHRSDPMHITIKS